MVPAPVLVEEEAPKSPLPVPIEAMRADMSLAVTTAKSTTVYTGRGPWFLQVAQLEPSTPLEYLESREGWFRVQLADGRRGWLPATDLTVTDSREPGARYGIQAGRWELTTPAGLRVEVTRRAPGVIRLLLEGVELTEAVPAGDKGLAVLTAAPGAFRGGLHIGDSGVGKVSVTEHGLLVDLEKPTRHTVLAQTATRLELELRPTLAGVEPLPDGWGFVVEGETRPVVRPAEGALLVDIPAAVNQAKVPAGLTLEEVAPETGDNAQPISSLTAQIPVRMPAGGLRFRLPVPTSLYALSQPEPGRYELRWVSRGLQGKKVVIDPGHGGEETGAVGPSGVAEKQVNLGVALRLQSLLEAAGAQVVMTRTTDARVMDEAAAATLASYQERTQADLLARSTLSNQARADLFISIHANGGPPSDGGTEVFWAVPNLNAASSRRLAELAQAELLEALGLIDRGVKQRPFNVIRYSEAPAVLVELGFMTNAGEEALLLSDQGQQRAAEALFRAVSQYFGP